MKKENEQTQENTNVQSQKNMNKQTQESANEQMTENAGKQAQDTQGETTDNNSLANNPSSFKLIYESRDKELLCFEDKDGHLTMVRAARLA